MPLTKHKKCLTKAENQFERHQAGFDGEHIGHNTLRRMGYKDSATTNHRASMDIVTGKTAWEVKTFHYGAKHIQMGISAEQKAVKLAWCKANKKKAKSMLVLINDKSEVFIKDGLGKFRPGNMRKVRTIKNWREEVGHGRRERFYKVTGERKGLL